MGVVTLLLGLHSVYTKYWCFVSEWDSPASICSRNFTSNDLSFRLHSIDCFGTLVLLCRSIFYNHTPYMNGSCSRGLSRSLGITAINQCRWKNERKYLLSQTNLINGINIFVRKWLPEKCTEIGTRNGCIMTPKAEIGLTQVGLHIDGRTAYTNICVYASTLFITLLLISTCNGGFIILLITTYLFTYRGYFGH